MTEEEIFNSLKSLCHSPGYAHAIAYICHRDNMVRYQQEIRAEDLQPMFGHERLIRTEITTLIGLFIQGDIDLTLPAPNVFQSYIDQTETLMKQLHAAMGMGMGMGMMAGLVGADGVLDPDPVALHRGMALREPIFYGSESAYSFQYRDFAVEKYKADDGWLRKNKGFGIQAARDVVKAMGDLQNRKVRETHQAFDMSKPESWTILPSYIQTVQELAQASGVSINQVSAIVAAFSVQEKNLQFTSVSEFNSVTATPLIPLPDGSVILFQYYSIAEALYESPFYWMGQDKAYSPTAFQNRGNFTEAFTAARLTKVFGKDNVYSNINLVQKKNKVGEIDVMVSFGDRLIVVQAKSKRLTLEARKGNDGLIRADFKKAVQESYDQAWLCSQHLLANDCVLQDAEGEEVFLKLRAKEIFIFNVIADHYPALSFQSSQFLKFQESEHIRAPFVMDVFTLDAITEMLESPLRLLFYVRQRVQYLDKLSMSHELTALSYHLRVNLFLEDKGCDFFMLGDDISTELDLGMIVRREGIEGPRTPDGILTRMAGTQYERLIKQIEMRADPPCIQLGFFLMTLAEGTCQAISRGIESLMRSTSADKKAHDLTIGSGDEGVTFQCAPILTIDATKRLSDYGRRRKYAQKAKRWFLVFLNPQANIEAGIAMEAPWEHSIAMDKETAGMRQGINAQAFKTPRTTQQAKVGRNERCPCGSGRKYKRCHLGVG